MSLDIACWAGASAGCRWWRLETPADVLRRRGHTVTISTYAIPSVFARADVIVGQQVHKDGATDLWHRWAAAGRHLVYDIDDDMLAVDDSNPTAKALFERHPRLRSNIIANMRAASVVTAATPELARRARAYTDRVMVVPNGLPAQVVRWPKPDRQPGRLVVGWSGSVQTLPSLALAAEALTWLLDTYPDVVVRIVGIDPNQATAAAKLAAVGIDPDRVDLVGWLPPGEAYLRACHTFDLWVAPYHDTPFNAAKVPTKMIEASCLGVPLVASAIQPYRQAIRHDKTGVLIREPRQWQRVLRRLVDHPDQLARLASASAGQAHRHLVESTIPDWETALTTGRTTP